MGKETIIPAPKEDRDFGVEFLSRTPELIEKYGVKALPIKVRGGLDDVTQGWKKQEVRSPSKSY